MASSSSSSSEEMKDMEDKKKSEDSESEVEKKEGNKESNKDLKKKTKKSWIQKKMSLRGSKKGFPDVPSSPFMSEEMWAKIKEKELYPIQLHFKDIKFSVPPPKNLLDSCKRNVSKEWVEILHGVSGTFEPGSITAIMGSSGAGKTTLLDVLAGRAQGRIEGEILYNGLPRDEAKSLLRHQAYVMQADIMLGSQTPREILTFAANLRMSKKYSKEQREKRVNELIDELNIAYCQNTQVGSAGEKRGISGGERKRVAIGTELITNPSLLFLDEPTSGLDSETAESVMEALRHLAEHGRTIICTIHQPNSDIFAKFDNLILLAKGHIIYNGSAQHAIEYFKSIGHPVPAFTNPPDFFMGLIHVDASDPESGKNIDSLIEAWEKSPEHEKVSNVQIVEPKPMDEDKEKEETKLQQGFLAQTAQLIKRNLSDTRRNPLKIRASLGQTLFLGVLFGLIYLQLGKTQQDIQSRLGALFFMLMNQTMSNIFSIINTYHEEKSVFLRENKNHMYSVTAYYVAKLVADLPTQAIFPTVFVTIVYWMIGFKNDGLTFLYVWLAVLMSSNIGAAIGLCAGTIASSSSVAIAVTPLVVLPFVIFSGFLINRDNVPPYFIWCDYLSFFKYCLTIIVVKTFEGQKFTCDDNLKIGGVCPISTGEEVITSRYYDEISVRDCFLILLGMLLLFRLIAYLVLVRKVSKAASNS